MLWFMFAYVFKQEQSETTPYAHLPALVNVLLVTCAWTEDLEYCQSSNIWHTKSQNLTVSHLILQLSLPNPLKPGVKSKM